MSEVRSYTFILLCNQPLRILAKYLKHLLPKLGVASSILAVVAKPNTFEHTLRLPRVSTAHHYFSHQFIKHKREKTGNATGYFRAPSSRYKKVGNGRQAHHQEGAA